MGLPSGCEITDCDQAELPAFEIPTAGYERKAPEPVGSDEG